MNLQLAAVILAAGLGKRMKSARVKVLHHLSGKPLICHVIDNLASLKPASMVVVLGRQAEEVAEVITDCNFVVQEQPLGTADAVKATAAVLADWRGALMVVPGDAPFLSPATLKKLVSEFKKSDAAAALLTAPVEEPTGYGRVKLSVSGNVEAVVEEKDADETEKQIKTINSGVYCFQAAKLWPALQQVKNNNQQGEYYLTDVVAVLSRGGERVVAVTAPAEEIVGINNRIQLAAAEVRLQKALKESLMLKGVTFIMPETTYIGAEVEIGPDTVVLPHCHISGKVRIGDNCRLGPGAMLVDSQIGRGTEIIYSVIRGAVVEEGAKIGPYCSLRPGTFIKKGAKAGTFVEIKKTVVGEGSKVPHLSYMGDAEIGVGVNVGAGTITCNYDGRRKQRTVIKDGAFIGSDTMLIAPVTIGKRAVTGAGSAISKDVPDGGLGVERGPQNNIEGWADNRRDDD